MKKFGSMFGAVIALAVFAGSANAGGTLTLKSYDEHVRISVLNWMPRVPVGGIDAPDLGNKIIGVKVRVANLANTSFDTYSLTNGATISDTQHRSYESTIIVTGPSPEIDDAKILPHDYSIGWMFFEVPASSHLRLLSVTLDSGFADEAGGTAVWRF